jgi:hypothetical protein
MDKKLNRKCIINPKTGHAVVEGSKIYKQLDSSAKALQAVVKAKLTKPPPPKPSPTPPKPKALKPKPSPKVDDDNWFLPYVRKEASQILQAVARRQAVKNKNK